MAELFNIPITYKEGVYHIKDLEENEGETIEFDHDSYGDILTYTVPCGEDGLEIILYGIPKEELAETMTAFYDPNGKLQKITAILNGNETLLYIHYTDTANAREEIKRFAIKNADQITEKICACTDVVARLFIEYFYDGEAMDFHAKVGTAEQKEALDEDIWDSPGDYPHDILAGDNDTLKIMVTCAGDSDFFQYAVDIMAKHIEENAVGQLRKTDDFKFLCMEYD